MPRFLSLVNFAAEGIREVQDSVSRAHAFQTAVKADGGKVEEIFWAMGEFDGIIIFQAPSDAAAASLLTRLGKGGHVRTRTMLLYNAEEFQKIVAKT